jgi:alpha-1,3-rhamnosyltransferase
VGLCRLWLNTHNERFEYATILTTEVNTGVSSNANRGIKITKGEWVKPIAGDDILMDNCIQEYVDFVYLNKDEIFFLHSNFYELYDNDFEKVLKASNKNNHFFNLPETSIAKQQLLIVRGHDICAATIFFKKILWQQIGGFDEELPFEDWPFYIKALENNKKLVFKTSHLVKYRIHNESIYNSNRGQLAFNSFYKSDRVVYLKLRKSGLTLIERWNEDVFFYYKILL